MRNAKCEIPLPVKREIEIINSQLLIKNNLDKNAQEVLNNSLIFSSFHYTRAPCSLIILHHYPPKKEDFLSEILCSSGGRTRTYDLRVMSPTSYRLLYSAVWECKGKDFF